MQTLHLSQPFFSDSSYVAILLWLWKPENIEYLQRMQKQVPSYNHKEATLNAM